MPFLSSRRVCAVIFSSSQTSRAIVEVLNRVFVCTLFIASASLQPSLKNSLQIKISFRIADNHFLVIFPRYSQHYHKQTNLRQLLPVDT